MATEKITLGVDIVSNTEAEIVKGVKLKKTYEDVQKAAGNISGTAGSRAVAAKAAPVSSGGLTGQQYGTAQAASGMGSSARDFAKEAQGLGGLVRVYATFAANLFAVSAAFTALRDAASTTNIIKGLDQLGAASGRNLGTLAKQLSAASDGAISLRDSMTAVAQASSGGLANKQILQLGDVAKKASEALGLSMPDALSRLSRGITKIEPELLDELGIFVKVDEASQKYALSLGKTVASLSDFEKRQAFANAVLDQGTKKFGEIKIDANPYDKLLASISNIATVGLQLVNTVLGPIAKILSESPTALAGVFALIGMTLLKQAIPALSQWRGELNKSAESAAASAKRSYEAFSEYSVIKAVSKELKEVAPLQKQVNAKISEAQTELAKSLSSKSKILAQAMSGSADPAVMQKSLATEEKRRETILKNLDAQKQADITAGTATAAKLSAYAKEEEAQQRQLIGIKAASNAYASAAKTQKDITDIQVKSESVGFEEKIRKLIAERAKNIAVSKGILAQVGSDTETRGMGRAFTNLFDNIKNGIPVFDEFGKVVKDQDGKITRATQGLTGLRAATTALSGSFLVVGDAIGKGLSALGPYLQLFALAITAYEIFNSFASSAAKQQEALNTKFEESSASIKAVNDVFTLYTQKKKDAFGIEGIVAFTNALSQVSAAFDAQLDALLEFRKAAGVWDTLKDDIAGIFGKSNTDNIKKNAVDSVKAILKSLEFSSGGDAAKKGIAGILNLKPEQLNDINALKKATKELDEVGLGKLAKEFKTIEEREQFSTNAAKAFMESLAGINKLVDQLIQSNAFTDLQGKLGVELVNASDRLAQALNDPLKALTDIAAIGKDPKLLAIIGTEDLKYLTEAGALMKDISQAQADLTRRSEEVKQAQRDTSSVAITGNPMGDVSGGDNFASEAAKAAEAAANEAYSKADENLKNLKKRAIEFAGQGVDLVTKISDEGFKRISLGLKLAQEQATLTVQSARLGYAAQAGLDTSKQEADVKRAEINIQERLIKASYDAEIATIENTKILQRLTATQEVLAAEALRAKTGTAEEKAANAKLADTMSESAKKTMSRIDAQAALKNNDPRARASAMRTYGEDTVKLAQAANKSEQIPAIKLQGELAKTSAQKQVVDLDEINKKQAYTFKLQQAQLGLEKERLTLQAEGLNNYAQLSAYITPLLAIEKENLSLANLKSDINTKASVIAREKVLIEQNSKSVSKETYEDQIALNNKKTENLTLEEKTKKFAIEINTIKEKGAGVQAKLAQESAIELEKQKLKNSIEESRLNNLQAELGFKQQLGLIDEKTANAQKAQYDTQLLNLKSTEEEARIKADIAAKDAALTLAKDLSAKAQTAGSQTAIDAATTSQTAAKAALDLANQQLSTLTQRTTLQQTAINQAKTYNDRLIEQKQHLEDLVSLTTSLGAVFGDVGTNIGNAVGAADALLKSQKDRKEALAAAGKDEKAIANIKAKFDKQEFANTTALLSGTKKLFKEKSTGYKVIDATEKAMHASRIASMVKEKVTQIQGTLEAMGITSMATAQAAIEKIPGVLMSFVESMGWPGVAAGAAFIASLGLGGGGGSSTFTPTAEQRQETQGTAMGYDSSGNKVQVRRGVFGDENAKSESIANSLEIIKDNSVDGLAYDNRMLRALEDLNEALNSAAKGLFGIKGLRAGSLSGVVEGTNTGGGLLGIGGLFSSSTSRSIIDSGLQLKGTFYDLAKGVRGTINTFETISTTVKKSGFLGFGGSTRTSVSTQFKDLADLDPKAFKALANTFNFAADLLYSTAETANVTSDAVTASLKSIKVDQMASLRGLTGENFTKELSAVIGSVLDDASLVIFSNFEKYANFGEGMIETVIRVVDTNKKVAQAIKNIGSSFDASKNYNITSQDITEALVKVAGGLDKFLDQTNFFTENFLTEAERLVPVQSAVSAELSRLGFASVSTQQQFKALVQGLDLTTDAGIKDFQALMRVQEGFIEVTKAVEDLNNKIYDFDISIYTELGNAEKALQLTREKELKALDDNLKPIQKYLNALKDESTVKAKIATAYKDQSAALKTTVTGLKNSIKTLNDYKTALTAGANSLLTPAEKYAQAKSTMLETASLARKVIDSASTPEDIAARDAAVSKLGSTSDAFLTSSKEMFASSDRYTQDFKTVLELLDASSLALSAQQTEAEKQQTALDASVSFLNLISTSTNTTATLLAELVTLQTATEIARSGAASAGSTAAMTIPAMASGGIARGLTLVGENGPELANFAAAARVYPNQASNDIFNTKELVAEIRSLKAEVSQLRADQKAQTGHLIAANYDANAKNAEAVAEFTDAALVDQTWKQRSQVKLA